MNVCACCRYRSVINSVTLFLLHPFMCIDLELYVASSDCGIAEHARYFYTFIHNEINIL